MLFRYNGTSLGVELMEIPLGYVDIIPTLVPTMGCRIRLPIPIPLMVVCSNLVKWPQSEKDFEFTRMSTETANFNLCILGTNLIPLWKVVIWLLVAISLPCLEYLVLVTPTLLVSHCKIFQVFLPVLILLLLLGLGSGTASKLQQASDDAISQGGWSFPYDSNCNLSMC